MTAERDYLVRQARERDAFLWTGYNLGGGKCVLHLCSILGDTILCVIARGGTASFLHKKGINIDPIW